MSFIFINVNHDVGYESSESIPISLGYILATLKANGWSGIILDDLRDRPLTLNVLEKWIRRLQPWVIGFTTYQSTINRIRFLCRYIKSRHRNIKVVLGGPQAVAMPSAALEDLEDVDALVRGDGEIVMSAMATALASGESLKAIQGISCRCNCAILDTEPVGAVPDDLDAYASPYLSEVLNLEGKDTAIVLSSRGCSHYCRFCITPHICKGKVRSHSIERTIEEMALLEKRGIGRYWFADPNFTANREKTEKLLEEKMRRGIRVPFWCQTRSDLVDSALLAKLHRAGADTIAFGLESGSPGVLAGTNKGIELDRLRENITAAHALGMETELFTIFGLPGETVDDARQTLDFVRSLGIPIHSNSGSQQMQLYFGSIYAKSPAVFGFRSLPAYTPRYLSFGDNYETETMSRDSIRKVRNMWALANEQMERDVYFKQRLFEVLDFLLENSEDLKNEPSFYAYGALASSAIEELELLVQFLEGYEDLNTGNPEAVAELVSALNFFKESTESVGASDRIIFDSRSFMDGVPFTGISGKYWDVLLGKGLLLQSFEEGFLGARENEEISFCFTFPNDYVQEELRGRQVEVQAKIHKVFKSVRIDGVEDVKRYQRENRYRFSDLDLLRGQNEILYYLALRDTNRADLVKKPSHFLTLVHKWAKLGKREGVARLAEMLNGNPNAMTALADTLAAAGKCSWALDYYKAVSQDQSSSVIKQVRCLLNLDSAEKAMNLLESVPEGNDLEFQETLLECLKRAKPESNRIPSLEHHVLDLRVTEAVERAKIVRSGPFSPPPIVHGIPHED